MPSRIEVQVQMIRAADPKTRPQVLEILDSAKDLGLKVLRIWAFSEGPIQYNTLQRYPGAAIQSHQPLEGVHKGRPREQGPPIVVGSTRLACKVLRVDHQGDEGCTLSLTELAKGSSLHIMRRRGQVPVLAATADVLWCLAAGVYDEKVLVGLDFAINEASKRGIRVVPVFANYWAMYGGIDQYNTWSFEAGSGKIPAHISSMLLPGTANMCYGQDTCQASQLVYHQDQLECRVKWMPAAQGLHWAFRSCREPDSAVLQLSHQHCSLSPCHWCHAGNCNGDATCRDDFYSDPVAVGYYKDHVRRIITRVNTFNGRAYRQGTPLHAKL